MKLDSNYHSVFKLTYHLVLVVKYRRKVINDPVEFNHDRDHVHILFSAHPNSTLSKYINAFKSASSRLVKKEFPEIRKHLWKEYFWSRSFCLLTTGGAPMEVIKKYIESQGEKNDHRTPVSHRAH
ncbi:IS200/IS605 family transposase [Kyrpidia spormannii]|uniref:Transposase n=2 Tax=Kyrpidia spormannii TaxID=2055160 RepID=A0ACA8Z7F3_9BACL|nr:IS200/IS605 family transposase [Kyrpidia spormannii]CAB3390877.1 transposase [Kyrpidia spormannii]CAB3391787.1 transposase [Kyrpidia spormannii]